MADINVYPKNDLMRKYLRHPIGRGFENHPDSTPWPHDQFTMRRIKDGSIVKADPKVPETK